MAPSAKTYQGHGTDRALWDGIMDLPRMIFEYVILLRLRREQGIQYNFIINETEKPICNPNTVDIQMTDENNTVMNVRGESLGGGKVRIVRINQVKVDFYR